MKYSILHDLPGRLRVHCLDVQPSRKNADAIGELLAMQDGVHSASLSPATGNLLIYYARFLPRKHVLSLLDVMHPGDWDGFGVGAPASPRLFETAVSGLVKAAVSSLLRRFLVPAPIRCAVIVWKSLPFLYRAVCSLLRGRLDMAVAQGVALAVLALRRDLAAMRSILFLFSASEERDDGAGRDRRADLAAILVAMVFSGVVSPQNAALLHKAATLATTVGGRALPQQMPEEAVLEFCPVVEVEIVDDALAPDTAATA